MKISKRQMLFCLFTVLLCGILSMQKNFLSAATKGVVTASNLNLRSGPSVSYSIVVSLSKNTEVSITSTSKDSKGKQWYKVSVKVNAVTKTGYVSADYIKVSDTQSSTTTVSSFVKRIGYVNATSLNIRKSKSVSAAKVANIKKGKTVTVLGKATVNKVKWYKISVTINKKTVTGYVVAKYIKLYATTVSSTLYSLAKVNTANIPLYLTANVYDKERASLSKNQAVIIRGKLIVNSVSYTKVTAIVNKKGMNGYVKTSYITAVKGTASVTTNYAAVTKAAVKAKRIAATMSANMASLKQGQVVHVTGEVTVSGVKWYRCTFSVSGSTLTGYLKSSYVDVSSEAEFLEQLEKFPASYQSALTKLHEQYPNWIFYALDTGLDWDTVIEKESIVGKNTIQSNQPAGGSISAYSVPFSYLSTDTGAYNWKTDTYTLCDGSNWYTAKDSVTAYYMDPRNSLSEDLIFQFESLAYDSKQKSSVVSSILSNTFMNENYSVTDKLTNEIVKGSYTDTFMSAGKTNNISPYFLAVRSKQELGVNGSSSVSGTYTGYEGYYNYYNIGASDSASGNAIANGLKYASTGTTYQRPWTNPLKSIMGGAEFIASSYINKGQSSLYLQKFNVVYEPYYAHQYMTNVKAPNSESKSSLAAYSDMDITNESFVFMIPVYNNMPSAAVKLPESNGNPNSYLEDITVKNGTNTLPLTPTFNYLTESYTMVVENSVSTITVSAEKVSSYASISGTGTYSLTAGQAKTISIVCTAGNGTKTTYTLKIMRKN